MLLPAPELKVSEWLNTDRILTLAGLRGQVVVIEAFQMLCPGCVHHGIPQAQRIAEQFRREDVAVLGLHTVFEHHDVMTPAALQVFIHENRLSFPVAVDMPDGHKGMPLTMQAYSMEGTPTLILIDRRGRLRQQVFGSSSDMAVGASIAALVAEPAAAPAKGTAQRATQG
ncbi:MAG: redoxin domain-containing protein [Burkholderiaceae bacterium]